MKNLIWMAALVAIYMLFFRTPSIPGEGATYVGETGMHEFSELLAKGQTLEDLKHEGIHTVIEVYMNNCGYCAQLESQFPMFLKARPDVAIQRVRIPQGQIDEKTYFGMQAMDICGAPHVLVYNDQGTLIAGDQCGKRRGTQYLYKWMQKERA